MTTILKQYKLNKFDFEVNSNKVWIGIAYADGKFETKWGRVLDGGQMASKTKTMVSGAAAESALELKRREKLSKGYRDSAVIESGEVKVNAVSKSNLKDLAVKQIGGDAADQTTLDLIEYLAEVNIHNITASTSIKYNAANATFSTPLGVLTPEAVSDARLILSEIQKFNQQNTFTSFSRKEKVRDYFQLVPKDFGRKIPDSSELLSSPNKIQAEADILDALEAGINLLTSDTDTEQVFKCRLVKLPHWTEDGKEKFRFIRELFEKTKNDHHHQTSNLKLNRVYEVDIEEMRTNFERVCQRINNVRNDLWHGTRASNLLSILKNGLMIPPASSAHCTGRMFGNGIYTSLQSTKALNYATNFWNGSGPRNQKTFMFLCDAALGKQFKPSSRTVSFPAAGTDSTWVEAGAAGVMNHECIVYDPAQINLRYLCEFGS